MMMGSPTDEYRDPTNRFTPEQARERQRQKKKERKKDHILLQDKKALELRRCEKRGEQQLSPFSDVLSENVKVELKREARRTEEGVGGYQQTFL